MTEPILDRIARESGVPDLVAVLADRLSPSDLNSLWLAVAQRRASKRNPAELLADWAKDRFVRPSTMAPDRLNAWERVALAALPAGFEALALSPLCPLGTVSAVATLSQNVVVSTARGTEVVADSTNVLALECAVRRRAYLRADARSATPVHLAAGHRLVRAQQYRDPRALAHFAAFSLCSSGRDPGRLGFELSAVAVHAGFYLRALRTHLGPKAGLRLSVTPFDVAEHSAAIEAQILAPLRAAHPGAVCEFDLERTRGRGYYEVLCFHVHVADGAGGWIELADGGSVPWTRALLSNAKERLVISGIGSERVAGWELT